MVIEDMRNTGVMGTPEEWFVPWDPSKDHVDWQDALSSVIKRATSENGTMAIKVMANQLHNVENCLSSFMSSDEVSTFPRVAKIFEGAIWIKLTRRDIVGQAISRVMSRQTGINHATAHAGDEHFAGNLQAGYQADYNQNTIYKYGAILKEVAAISLENLAWERFFETNGLTATELFYEDIAADRDMAHLDLIAHLAGITEPFERTDRKLVKLANNKNKVWRNRFFQDAAAKNFRVRQM